MNNTIYRVRNSDGGYCYAEAEACVLKPCEYDALIHALNERMPVLMDRMKNRWGKLGFNDTLDDRIYIQMPSGEKIYVLARWSRDANGIKLTTHTREQYNAGPASEGMPWHRPK